MNLQFDTVTGAKLRKTLHYHENHFRQHNRLLWEFSTVEISPYVFSFHSNTLVEMTGFIKGLGLGLAGEERPQAPTLF
jgi:hypothetical protein